MKKIAQSILLMLIMLGLGGVINAQDNAYARWKCVEPDSQNVSELAGHIVAFPETGTPIFRVRSYSGTSAGPLGNNQRWWPNDGNSAISWGNETGPNPDRYVQFAVTPENGYYFQADTLSLYLGGGGTDHIRANIVYDVSSSFDNPVQLNDTTLHLVKNAVELLEYKLNKLVKYGDTLFVRIYPWYDSSPSTSKYLYVQDVRIIGTSIDESSASAPVNVALPKVSGTPGSEKTAAITVDNLTGKNVTSIQFTLTYDKNVVSVLGTDVTGTLLEGQGTLEVNADTANGKLLVAWAGYPALSGEGDLLKLNMKFSNAGMTTLSTGNTFVLNGGMPAAIVTAGMAKSASVLVQGGSVSATAGDEIMIPVLVTELTAAQGVLSYDFTATYNSSIINITGYELAGTLSEGGSASINTTNPGSVNFAFASGSNLVGSGTLVYLVGTAVSAGVTNVDFTAFKFNTGSPVVAADAGIVAVAEANVAPSLSLDPAGPFAVNENETLTIQLMGSDQNSADVLTYTGENLPDGASVDSETGLFTWTPSYDQAGTYTMTFKVTDQGGLSASVEAEVTVANVNRAPEFTSEIPDNELIPVHNVPVEYQFQFEAEDPDGDPVTFRKISGPGAVSVDGRFTWTPMPDQAGKSYVLMVEVSDGELTAVSNKIIKVSDVVTGVEEEGIPKEFKLLQNFPNPFNPTTVIKYGLPKEAHVRLTVYNVLGQEVMTLVNENQSAGYHRVSFDANELNAGIYIYKLEAGDYVSIKKMIYMK
ncbi:peptidase S8 and S53 subtilisin kexin sedolisin [Melioribacter roseus P3M-2]|uniref:Peptidase S8 and S53 subtilisin kexin sedolisin n=1 Tax=Melioribacter roseus (strain DSM 23840 / JCM 17771 / VKM B-2668 / P3M-2) TaxID=1191523 RepID=I7A1A5_MELRP|nr:cohesin domain-containing protein [Melioribacter roseus]AFN73761.1 peptidase S8 and S53 subtilisin kexin sedolisin [Melioribacter roseus P3M-2]